MSNLYRCPFVDASYQDSVHLVKELQRKFSGNRPTKNKNCLWWPCFLTDRDEMSILFNRLAFHRCFLSTFSSFGQAVSEKIFRNWPTRNKNCIWRPCLLTYREKMRNLYREPPIDVLVHLDMRFQRRRLQCEKLTDVGRQAMSKTHISFRKVTWKRFYWK